MSIDGLSVVLPVDLDHRGPTLRLFFVSVASAYQNLISPLQPPHAVTIHCPVSFAKCACMRSEPRSEFRKGMETNDVRDPGTPALTIKRDTATRVGGFAIIKALMQLPSDRVPQDNC